MKKSYQVCDVCGNEKLEDIKTKKFRRVTLNYGITSMQSKTYDICDKCLKEFIRNRTNDNSASREN